ncbi:DUF6022 family protein [Oceanobacillus jeddahense]|uniref:DUF6022 family protein n=1 Tax=Oceanobacillus jeddahense TaxID=1462527 RepID=A0ABY5JUK4_9BACI|nr:DUF6022 family protein [Oceanobacillus jeddahense]UUI03460.1 DUF6022 family protein [Oceanobacillus jeddahense]
MNLNQDMTIQMLTAELAYYVEENWKTVLEENQDELFRLFPEYEDATYGMYLDKLLPPAWKQVEENGFRSNAELKEDDFVIAGFLKFRNSIEKVKWGGSSHEYRVFWITIINSNHEEIGTLLFELPHSHKNFHIPDSPKFTYTHKIDKREIRQEIIALMAEKSQ